jgi:hypothetical protein
VVRHKVLVLARGGSNPSSPAEMKNSSFRTDFFWRRDEKGASRKRTSELSVCSDLASSRSEKTPPKICSLGP